MGRNAKLHQHLESLENEFKALLVSGLEEALKTGNTWVFNDPESGSMVGNFFLNKTPQLQKLIDLAARITNLRRKLKEPFEKSIVDVYRRYATKQNYWKDDHRLGPRRMAEELLTHIANRERALDELVSETQR